MGHCAPASSTFRSDSSATPTASCRARESSPAQHLSADRVLAVEFGFSVSGSPTLDKLLQGCALLSELLAKSRPLRVQDLAAAAVPGGNLDQTALALAWRSAAEDISQRSAQIEALLSSTESALRASASALVTQARTLAATRTQSGIDSAAAAGLAALRQRRTERAVAAEVCSRFALLDLLDGLGLEGLIADPTRLDALDARTSSLLLERGAGLATVRSSAESLAGSSLADRQGCVDKLCAALRATTDGNAMAVWPCFPRVDSITLRIESKGHVQPLVAGWPRLRPRLAYERERPTSIREAIFLGSDDLFTRPRLCGVVLDEWSDERPSRRQVFGLAFHYDAPATESPKALLLGVPATDEQADWSALSLASLVRETLQWTGIGRRPGETWRVFTLSEADPARPADGALLICPDTAARLQRTYAWIARGRMNETCAVCVSWK